MPEEIENLGWNPNRVLFGLSRIGYTPHSAIADIVDNSVTNAASMSRRGNCYVNAVAESFFANHKKEKTR